VFNRGKASDVDEDADGSGLGVALPNLGQSAGLVSEGTEGAPVPGAVVQCLVDIQKHVAATLLAEKQGASVEIAALYKYLADFLTGVTMASSRKGKRRAAVTKVDFLLVGEREFDAETKKILSYLEDIATRVKSVRLPQHGPAPTDDDDHATTHGCPTKALEAVDEWKTRISALKSSECVFRRVR